MPIPNEYPEVPVASAAGIWPSTVMLVENSAPVGKTSVKPSPFEICALLGPAARSSVLDSGGVGGAVGVAGLLVAIATPATASTAPPSRPPIHNARFVVAFT